MSYRNRTGDSWKHRNDRSWRDKYPTRPKAGPRKADFEPQWTVEQLWYNPFKEERRYATDGQSVWTEWDPLPPSARPKTGVRIFDEWLQYISEGNSDMMAFCKRYGGLRTGDLDSVSFMLTGMGGLEFQMKYRLHTLNVLLRYTELTPEEVARRSGFGSKNNLYLTCKREYGISPMERRRAIQKKGDAGRYR